MDPVIQFAVYLIVGGLVLRQIKMFGPVRWVAKKSPWVAEFVECDLCVGSWFYMAWSLLLNTRLELSPLASWLGDVANIGVTGMVSAFLLVLFKESLEHFVIFYGDYKIYGAEVGEMEDAEQDG